VLTVLTQTPASLRAIGPDGPTVIGPSICSYCMAEASRWPPHDLRFVGGATLDSLKLDTVIRLF
jgi:hypothetical protein